jgi:hypothetical protein
MRGARLTAQVMLTLLTILTGSAAADNPRALVVAGLGGEPEYEIAFQTLAKDAAEHLRSAEVDVTLLAGEDASSDGVRRQLKALQRTSGTTALVFLFIGHGSFDGVAFRFNVAGRDFTAEELATWLGDASQTPQLVVVTGSASGAIHEPLAAPGRTVLTATRNGDERNVTVFPRFFVEALASDTADTDKDQRITATEAFDYAVAHLRDYYEKNDRIATEHPLRTGAGFGVPLAQLSAASKSTEGRDEGQVAKLEAAMAALRQRKDSMTADAYYAELEPLLLQMAAFELGPNTAAVEAATTPAATTTAAAPAPFTYILPKIDAPEFSPLQFELPALKIELPVLVAPETEEGSQ